MASLFRGNAKREGDKDKSRTGKLFSPRLGLAEDPFPVYSSHHEDYEIGEAIGHGASSTVYAARFKPLGLPCAVKVIDVDCLSVANIDRLRREASIMSLSKHPHVLRVRGEWLSGSKLYVATRLMAAGSLLDIMQYSHPDGFEESVVATVLKQALDGLQYFHLNSWIHRDIKAGNVLVDEDGTVLLADFGVSSVHVAESKSHGRETSARKSFVGTPAWMAPEVISGQPYDDHADIWSFGILALELSCGHAPSAYIDTAKAMHKTVFEAAPTVVEDGTKKYSKAFKDLVDACLQKEPSKRPTARKLLSHAFFKQAKRPSYLVAAILTGLPPLQARQTRRRAPSMGFATMSSSWHFGTVDSRGALTPLTSPNDPFASFTGRHAQTSPPASPMGSRLADLAAEAEAEGPLPRSPRRISFKVQDTPAGHHAATADELRDQSVLGRLGFR